jgi:hypothetical protein
MLVDLFRGIWPLAAVVIAIGALVELDYREKARRRERARRALATAARGFEDEDV